MLPISNFGNAKCDVKSVDWEYAKMSVMAKYNGGPEAYINKIFNEGKATGYNVGYAQGIEDGRTEVIGNIVYAISFVASATIFHYLMYRAHVKRTIKRISKIPSEYVEETKKELIEGIKKYDEFADID